MDDEVNLRETSRERAVEAATSGRPELAQAWALIGIYDELKTIRQEIHRQARANSAARRG